MLEILNLSESISVELQKLIVELALKELPHTNPEIRAIRYDSRKVGPGDLYVAVPGTRTHGHAFIPQVIEAGAVAVVCEADWFAAQSEPDPAIAWLPVENTRIALAQLSAAFYGQPASKMRLIGVTGTNGKTTTAHLISRLLTEQGLLCGWIGTLGAGYADVTLPGQYTTPFPPELHELLQQMLNAGVKAVVMECSSHALEQHRLDALSFDTAIFTNLTQDHLDYHQTMQAYAEAKALLFSRLLATEGTALINADDSRADQFFAACGRKKHLGYAIDTQADLKADDLVFDAEGARFALHWRGETLPVRMRLTGRYNVHNALAALGAALSLDLPLEPSLDVLASVSGVPGRLERVSPDGHPFAVYVDYAHTPDSLENALRAVRQFSRGRVLAVFGCGGDRDRSKRPLMGAAAEQLADQIFVTSDNPRSERPEAILEDILAGLARPDQAVVEVDRRAAIGLALAQAQSDDVVLIAGKGHETYQIIGERTLHFDDREEARQFLEMANKEHS